MFLKLKHRKSNSLRFKKQGITEFSCWTKFNLNFWFIQQFNSLSSFFLQLKPNMVQKVGPRASPWGSSMETELVFHHGVWVRGHFVLWGFVSSQLKLWMCIIITVNFHSLIYSFTSLKKACFLSLAVHRWPLYCFRFFTGLEPLIISIKTGKNLCPEIFAR